MAPQGRTRRVRRVLGGFRPALEPVLAVAGIALVGAVAIVTRSMERLNIVLSMCRRARPLAVRRMKAEGDRRGSKVALAGAQCCGGRPYL
ncbi:MAG TPA: hypothetical protein VIC06_03505 [Solirubrobacteraceae bacterium]